MHICLFDIDGTLIDTGGAGKAAMEATLTAEFDTPRESNGIAFAGRTDRSIVGDMFRLHGIDDTHDNFRRFCIQFVKHLPQQLHRIDGRVLPGVTALLELLRAQDNVILGLLTGNLKKGAKLKLDHYRLSTYFWTDSDVLGAFGDVRYSRDEVAHDALANVRDAHGDTVDVDRVWIIGDTPRDVQCARAINARIIAVATGFHTEAQLAESNPDRLLTDLSQPAHVLDLMRAS